MPNYRIVYFFCDGFLELQPAVARIDSAAYVDDLLNMIYESRIEGSQSGIGRGQLRLYAVSYIFITGSPLLMSPMCAL